VPGQVVAGLAEDLPKPALDVGQASPIWPADSPDDSAEALAGPDGPVGGQLGEGAAGLGLTPPSGLTGRTAGPVSGPTRYTRWTPSRLAPPSWLSGQGQQAGASGPEGLTDSLAEQAGSPGLGGASADDLLGLGSPSGLDDSLDEATLDGLTSGGSASSGPTSSGLASSGLAAPGAALFDPEPDGSGLTGATAFDPGRPPGLSGLGAEGAAAQPVQSGPLDRSGYGASFSPPAAGVIDDESTIVLEPVHLDRSQVETGPPPAVRPLSARRPQPRGRVGSAGLLATPVPRAGAEAGDSSASLVAPPDGTAAGPLRSAGLLPGDATQDLPPVPDLPGLEPGRQAPGVDAVALDGPTAPDPAGGTARAGEVLFDTDTPSFERVIDGEPDDQAAGRQWSWGPVIVFVLVVLACLVLGVVLLLTQVGILGLEVDLSPIEPRAWPGSRVV
jgi:hypothetical protein